MLRTMLRKRVKWIGREEKQAAITHAEVADDDEQPSKRANVSALDEPDVREREREREGRREREYVCWAMEEHNTHTHTHNTTHLQRTHTRTHMYNLVTSFTRATLRPRLPWTRRLVRM